MEGKKEGGYWPDNGQQEHTICLPRRNNTQRERSTSICCRETRVRLSSSSSSSSAASSSLGGDKEKSRNSVWESRRAGRFRALGRLGALGRQEVAHVCYEEDERRPRRD